MPISNEKPYVGMDEAAEYLGVKKSWLYKRCMEGNIPFYKIGHFNKFSLLELEKWVSEKRSGKDC